MLRVSSILIGVNNLQKSKPFYEKVFGFTFDEFRPPFASATFGGLEFNIEENADYRSSDWAQKTIGGKKSITFETDDLDSFLKLVQREGGSVVEPSSKQSWGWYTAIVADPDGNEFVIEKEA